jgi:hypothetical protein
MKRNFRKVKNPAKQMKAGRRPVGRPRKEAAPGLSQTEEQKARCQEKQKTLIERKIIER